MRQHEVTRSCRAAVTVALVFATLGCGTQPGDRVFSAASTNDAREVLPKIIPAEAIRKALGLSALSLKTETCPKPTPPGSSAPPPDCRYSAIVRLTTEGYCLVIAPDVKILAGPPFGPRDIEWQLDRTAVTSMNLNFEFHDRHGILIVVDDSTAPQFPGAFHKRLAPDLFQIRSLRTKRVNGIYLPAVVMRDSNDPNRVELCAAIDPKIVND